MTEQLTNNDTIKKFVQNEFFYITKEVYNLRDEENKLNALTTNVNFQRSSLLHRLKLINEVIKNNPELKPEGGSNIDLEFYIVHLEEKINGETPINKLINWKPEGFGDKLFFSEEILYNLIGKDNARTLLFLMRNAFKEFNS